MYYIKFNQSHELESRFLEGTNSGEVPEGAVQVDEELFWKTAREQDGTWKINRDTGEIFKVPHIIPVAYPRFTALEMLDLFTEEEQLAVVSATMSVPEVKLWYDRMMAATFVTYEDPRTEAGLVALVQAGLLTEQRKAEIVAAMQPGQ